MIILNRDKCTQCGLCESACPFGAISMDEYPVIGDTCVGCNQCVDACPAGALSGDEGEKSTEDLSAYKNVWVVAEVDPVKNKLKKVTLELLTEGRRIADLLGEKVVTLFAGADMPPNLTRAVSDAGSDEMLVVSRPELSVYTAEVYAKVIAEVVRDRKPAVLLMGATEIGRGLAPRIAAELKTGLTADCTGFDVDENGLLVQIRPTYGGSIMASIISPDHRPQMASVRPNVFTVQRDETRPDVSVEEYTGKLSIPEPLVRVLGYEESTSNYKNVAESEVVIVAGYGVGGKENLQVIQKLAHAMGAALGVTRKVVDEGWAPYELQVGQTGKTIAPELYIGFGVSGALQHTIGLRNAKHIIAVNNDPAAPIFNTANEAILGDCVSVAKELTALIERRRG